MTVMIGLLIQLFITYPVILKIFSKVKFTSLYQAIAEAMMVAFGTASGSATLPVTIACCERRAGISSKICSFVLPLGATMTMDATAMFQTIAVIFLAQAYGVTLDPFTDFADLCVWLLLHQALPVVFQAADVITIIVILNGLGFPWSRLVQAFTFYLLLID